ncbi:AI-2E family transporter [Lysobacter pythonis]|uniref:AI-2E family transporter n=1 Tax=Solilutibacter pythonis TaxID=2483112 RepID=A0A3M2I1R7_9GAMM|nr:AI-2E family transporter [Lysobacter pythonis]RMH94103.1 AI-2E family transporter [Lysobacter pythonis]
MKPQHPPRQASLADIAAFFRRLQWAAVAVGVIWLVSLLAPILTPFVIAAMLGWLGDPLVDRIEARGVGRNTAVIAVFTGMSLGLLVVVLILVPVIARQIMTLVESWPEYQAWFANWFTGRLAPWVLAKFKFDLLAWFDSEHLMAMLREHWQRVGGVAATVLGFLSRSGMGMVLWLTNLVLIPVLAFFFLRDWDRFVERIAALIPRDHLSTVTQLAKESDAVLGGFLRGQFLVMVALGVMYGLGLWLVGVKVGILIGVIGGLLSFVPYLGPASVVVMGGIAALVQGGGWPMLAGVGVVFTVAQLIESYLLTPKLVGDRIGLHPMAVIFAVMAGGVLFGFVGMLLALPGAAVINVLLHFAVERYRASRIYVGEQPAIVLEQAKGSRLLMPEEDTGPPEA